MSLTNTSDVTSKVTAYLLPEGQTLANSTSATYAYTTEGRIPANSTGTTYAYPVTTGVNLTTSPPPSDPNNIVALTKPLNLPVPSPEGPGDLMYNMTGEEAAEDHVIMEIVKFSEPADIVLGCLIIVMSIIALTGKSKIFVTYNLRSRATVETLVLLQTSSWLLLGRIAVTN